MGVIYRIMDENKFLEEYKTGESQHNRMQHALLVAQLNYEKLVTKSGHWSITPQEIEAKNAKYDECITAVKADFKEKTGQDFPEDWGM